MNKEIQNFILELKGSSSVEFNNLYALTRDFTGRNIYFCAGVKDGMTARCKNEDIVSKKYMFIDIDIRMCYYDKHGKVLDDDELYMLMTKVLQKISDHKLDSYRYSVHSGNGLHLYYTGTERPIDKDVYSAGLKQIHKLINDAIVGLDMSVDGGCHNIGRISRLPGSINPRVKVKEGKELWNCGDMVCEILDNKEQDSDLFNDIEMFAIAFNEEEADRKRVKEIIKKEYKKSEEDIRSQINAIDIVDIAETVRGVTAKDRNEETITLKEQHKNMGAYIYKPYNIVVNTGSSMIKSKRSTYTVWELVYYEMMNEDKTKTIDFFKTKFNISDDKKQEPIKIIQASNDDMDFETTMKYTRGNISVDKKFGYISNDFVVIASYPGMGKTAWTTWMADRNGSKGVKVCYYTLELSPKNLKTRYAYTSVGLSKYDYQSKNYTDQQKINMGMKYKEFDRNFTLISFNDLPTIETLKADIIQRQSEGYEMFIIDNLGKIKGQQTQSELDIHSQITSELQTLKNNYPIAIVLVHHYSKPKTGEMGSQGGMHKIRGSQKISDNATIMIEIRRNVDPFEKDNTTTIYQYKDSATGLISEIDIMYDKGIYLDIINSNVY